MDIKIIVAAHRPYEMPKEDIYLPIHVGKKGKKSFGIKGDDTGDNISEKNPYFCELTAIYWAYKNLDADFIGLAHYRRQFSLKPKTSDFSSVLSSEQAKELVSKNDVILPRKQRYFIESLYSHYAHTHDEEHLKVLRGVICDICPEYLPHFIALKKRTSAHMFNMFIMKKEIFVSYCEWLFKLLFEAEKRLDLESMPPFEKRVIGRYAELLLDMWIEHNGIKYKEIPYVYMEKVDYVKKVRAFLKAKFLGKKYDKSF